MFLRFDSSELFEESLLLVIIGHNNKTARVKFPLPSIYVLTI